MLEEEAREMGEEELASPEVAMVFKIVIPARYASTRLPAKPLADIAGKPMIVRVVERVQGAGADEIWVATDKRLVLEAVQAAGLPTPC